MRGRNKAVLPNAITINWKDGINSFAAFFVSFFVYRRYFLIIGWKEEAKRTLTQPIWVVFRWDNCKTVLILTGALKNEHFFHHVTMSRYRFYGVSRMQGQNIYLNWVVNNLRHEINDQILMMHVITNTLRYLRIKKSPKRCQTMRKH